MFEYDKSDVKWRKEERELTDQQLKIQQWKPVEK